MNLSKISFFAMFFYPLLSFYMFFFFLICEYMIAHHTGRVMCLVYVNNHVWSGSFDKSFVLWDSEVRARATRGER